MEGVPNTEPASLENAQQINLLEAYADTEVTIFGITGTFKDLAEMCPVDLNDPSITQEAINEFTVKVANQAAIEVEPEHEAAFARITESLGLERSFGVAKSIDISVDRPRSVNQPDELKDRRNIIFDELSFQKRLEPAPAAKDRLASQTDDLENQHLLASEPIMTVPNKLFEIPTTTELITADAIQESVEIMAYESELATVLLAVEGLDPVAAPAEIAEEATNGSVLVVDSQLDELWTALQPADVAEVFDNPIDFEIVETKIGLNDKLHNLCDDFIEVLSSFSESLILSPEDNEVEETELTPSTITFLAGALSELKPEQMELVLPILEDIIGAIHSLQILEDKKSDPEAWAAEALLEEACISLLVTLGIEYDEQDIKRLTQVILQAELRLPLAVQTEQELDLEHMGTREVKTHFPQFSSALVAMSNQLQHALGFFVLLCAS